MNEFLMGLVAGGSVVLVVTALLRIIPSLRRWHFGHLAAPIAALILLADNQGGVGLFTGVAVAAVGSMITEVTPSQKTIGSTLGIAGAVIAVASTSAEVSYGLIAFLGIVTAEAALGMEKLRYAASWVTSLMIVTTLTGMWLAVADTETILVVAGCLLPFLAFSALDASADSQLPPWPTATVIAISASWGTTGRPASLPGALCAWGLILLIPLATAVGLDLALLTRKVGTALVAVHVPVVLLASRWAARTADTKTGLLRSAVVLVGAFVVLAGLSRLMGQPPPTYSPSEPGPPQR